jgi:hypothetical protein
MILPVMKPVFEKVFYYGLLTVTSSQPNIVSSNAITYTNERLTFNGQKLKYTGA